MVFSRRLTHVLTAAGVAALLTVGGCGLLFAENNGLERTPILGWSSWSFLRKHPSAAAIKAQALALHDSGLQKLGYEYVNLDDFWYGCPGPQGPDVGHYGFWATDAAEFPPDGNSNGIKVVANYVHSLGLKFGIYVTPGISKQAVEKNTPIKGTHYTAAEIAEPSVSESNYNCHGMVGINFKHPGAQAFINSWADEFASWGVDFVKLDGVQNWNAPYVEAWSKAIRQSGRPMVLDVTQGNFTRVLAPVLVKYADQWVPPPDVEAYHLEKNGSSYPLTDWTNVAKRFNYVAEWQPYAGPGHFNDYDSIEVGNGENNGLTPAERETQLSLWALGSAPLILGVDLTHLDQRDLHEYLENKAIIAVDQDAIAAKRIVDTGTQQVFAKTERNGDVIVGLFNTGEHPEKISVQGSDLGLPVSGRGYRLDDLWTGRKSRTGTTISGVVPPHGVVLYRVTVP